MRAGTAANTKADSTQGPIPGTLRWIMKGSTLIAAPSIAQIPVAVRAVRLIFRDNPERLAGGVFNVSMLSTHTAPTPRRQVFHLPEFAVCVHGGSFLLLG